MTAENNAPRLQVTLVHGTWAARRSKWTKPGSPLWQALNEAGADCHRFVWSGRNSHRARRQAAERLAQHLVDLGVTSAGSPSAVVAHSHGGNVALHAVWRVLGQDPTRVKVVTLATPYFFAERRDNSPRLDAAISWLVAVYVIPLVVFSWGKPDELATPFTFPLLIGALVGLAVQAFGWAYFRLAHGAAHRPDIQAAVVGSIQTPPIPEPAKSQDLLVIRAADDEAGGLLGTAQFSGWLGFTASRIARPARAILLIWIAGFALYEMKSSGFRPFGVDLTPVLPLLDWTFPAFSALFLAMALPAISALAHGFDGPTTSKFAVVTAEASPPGNAVVWQREIRPARANGLAHSSLYDDPTVIARIVDHATDWAR